MDAPQHEERAGEARSRVDDPILDVSNIDTYYGLSQALHDVTITVGEGEVVSLVGRNGAGKTTTLRSIMGITPPNRGTIELNGQEIQGNKPHQIRHSGVSWVPEDRRVFSELSVEDNLDMALTTGTNDRDKADIYDRFPRLEERRTQAAGTLSGGEQQMLAIARALLGPPIELLLLDEPSEGLAPMIVEEITDIIRSLSDDDVTLLLVEQNAELALELSDWAYVIETGRIVHEDHADALLGDRELLEQYLGVK
ncbi:ABC transporter ATP-binding protein [Natrarchaeobius oligotrophus]|uniref:ABC transporter ATP-binding protein n=1 Tax=Natrarchaeobius chitinivorans TaxID=1679083 RepID=A0A3N6PKW6_NATCH|nr:ABC transporter ATP-binding protein [Natrarchaeobius chitinivorans]RQG99475.1 ABC transporter ATP-binding protein [Natrarchaeobius chitinivorans]